MQRGVVGAQSQGFRVGFGGFWPAGFLERDAQVEPALKSIGRDFDQGGTVRGGLFVVLNREGGGGQALMRGP